MEDEQIQQFEEQEEKEEMEMAWVKIWFGWENT